jgi:hypothetical protein
MRDIRGLRGSYDSIVIYILLRAAIAVYTVYDIYLQHFDSTSPLNIYFRSYKKCGDKIYIVLYIYR